MKTKTPRLASLAVVFASALIIVVTALTVFAQSAPVLTVTPTTTNTLSITITNGVPSANYELWTTPVLGNVATYPWIITAVGTAGQTNFTVNVGPYPTGFFRAVRDTNAIPLWEIADPNNPSAGILTVFIDSPTNGASLQ